MKLMSEHAVGTSASKVSVNPSDASQIVTSGQQHLRLWRLEKDLSLKPNTLLPAKREKKENFTDHAWTPNDNFLIASTSEGTLFVFLITETTVEPFAPMPLQSQSHVRITSIATFRTGTQASGTPADAEHSRV